MDQKWCPKRAKPQHRPERPPGTRKGPKMASPGLLLASLWRPFGLPWPPFGPPWAPFRRSVATLRLSLASFAPLWPPRGVPLAPWGPPWAAVWLPSNQIEAKIVPKRSPKPKKPSERQKTAEDDAEICTKNERMNTYALYTHPPPGPERVYCRRQLRSSNNHSKNNFGQTNVNF